MSLQTCEEVLLKVSPMKGVIIFREKVKPCPQYTVHFEVLDSLGLVAYRLVLPPNL